MSIADNIKALREKYNLTQAELGEIAGVSDKAVSTWEKGTAEPRMGAIQKIAAHFNISKGSLVDDIDDPEEYYIDPEVAQLAQDLKDNPDIKVLFDASRNLSKEDIQFVIDMIERMK